MSDARYAMRDGSSEQKNKKTKEHGVMRAITLILVHCSAVMPGQTSSAEEIDAWHRAQGWNGIGYHYVIRRDGSIENGRPLDVVGAHCKGHNRESIGVCYEGGLDENGKPKDTRTPEQKQAMSKLIGELKQRFPNAEVRGHNEFNTHKACPCFSVKLVRVWILGLMLMLCVTSCRTQREVVTTESVRQNYESHRDTLREVQYVYDSIYIDSREATQTRNDTVYRDQIRVEYRYRVLHDTVRVRSEELALRSEESAVRSEEAKLVWDYIPWYARCLLWVGIVLILIYGVRYKLNKN